MIQTIEATRDALLEHFEAAYLLARRMTGNPADAEDAVQEAYLRATRFAGSIPVGDRSVSLRWFLKVVANVVRNQQLANRRRRDREQRMLLARQAEERPAGPETPADERELREVLAAAMDELDEKYRTVLALHYEQGLPHTEVAEILGIPASTVRTRASRGLEQLRRVVARSGRRVNTALLVVALARGLEVVASPALAAAVEAAVVTGLTSASAALAAGAGTAATATATAGQAAAAGLAAKAGGLLLTAKTTVTALAATAAVTLVTLHEPGGNQDGAVSADQSHVAAVARPLTPEEIEQRLKQRYPDPIDMEVPPLREDKSVRWDFDIVYVRMPRSGDDHRSIWAEVSRPHRMDPGGDLVLLHPDGREEVLVEGGVGSVADPMVSFDGQWVYYARFHDLTVKHDGGAGADIYKIHVPTRRIVRLTNFGFLPNTGAADWSAEVVPGGEGKSRPRHALYNLNPCPLPGGKVIFVSNRHAFRPPSSPGNGAPTLQLFVMDDRDADATPGDEANLECIGHLNLGMALHPVVLADGRVMFSSMESQGIRTHLEWGLWHIRPDGTQWGPLVSAFALEGGAVNSFHFQAQLSDGSVVFEEYYVGSNFGMGTLRKFPIAFGDYPQFGPAYRRDPRNPPLRSGRHPNGHPAFVRLPFSPAGLESLTPFAHGSDREADHCVCEDRDSPRVGKFTHPAPAPENHVLVVYTPGPGHTQRGPQADAGLYLIKHGLPVDEPAQMRLVKNAPRYNEQWPRALIPYKQIYGIAQPPQLPALVNDGSRSPHLPAGTPYGLVGTSSLYKRESYPDGVVPPGAVTATYAGGGGEHRDPWQGLDAFTSHGNGMTSNWVNQGADAGLYANDEIHAIRIVVQEPTTDLNRTTFYNHARERMRILGEIPVRKFLADGSQPTDPDGHPDTSFLAKIPADTPFTFQTIDARGMVLNMAQTWHQLRPGEIRHDCGGCHAHSQSPTRFEDTAAALPDYKVFDLTRHTPLVADKAADESRRRWDAEDATGLRYQQQVYDVEYHRHIAPILRRSCAACHREPASQAPEKLVLDPDAPPVEEGGRKWPAPYYRLALDNASRFGHKPAGWDSWGYYQASRYVRKLQSRRSLLTWKILGERTDGFDNADHPSESKPGAGDLVHQGEALDIQRYRHRFDVDFVGSIMPPPEAVEGKYTGPDGKPLRVEPLSDEDRRTIVRWIDLGCPIDLDYSPDDPQRRGEGWLLDETRPTLALAFPLPGKNQHVTRILIGMHDYNTGLDETSLAVTADFALDGVPAGENLAGHFKPEAPGVWAMELKQPITRLPRGRLTVSVRDRQGNTARVVRAFSVGE